MKKIGIFAGTFDPIHEGHLAFGHAALALGLEKVLFLVEPRPRRKQGVHALEHRIAMAQLAVSDEERFGTIALKQARFTPHETIPILKELFVGYELVFLFGDDVIGYMVDHIAAWPHIEDLASSASLVIATRSEKQAELAAKLALLKKNHGLPFRYEFVEPNMETIGSSKIRMSLRRGEEPSGLPSVVREYVEENGLYLPEEIIS
jgi:nicotinate-nucleotide adenylyltransferase